MEAFARTKLNYNPANNFNNNLNFNIGSRSCRWFQQDGTRIITQCTHIKDVTSCISIDIYDVQRAVNTID